jgi:carbamoyl-phosphate synthase large subunit
MSSTGEVACFGKDYDEALLKSILSANKFDFKTKSVLLSLGGPVNKVKFLESAQTLYTLGYTIYATDTTALFLESNDIHCQTVRKAFENSPNVLDIIDGKKVAFVVNLSKGKTESKQSKQMRLVTDGFKIRRATVDNQIPLFTDLNLTRAFIKALSLYRVCDLEIKSYREYTENK